MGFEIRCLVFLVLFRSLVGDYVWGGRVVFVFEL